MILGALSGCTTQAGFMTTTAKADELLVSLKCDLKSREQASAVIAYTVSNKRDHRIYVFHLLYHTDAQGNRTPDPELAYVHYLNKTTALVGKYLIGIPPGRKVESPEMPYLDPLAPGQTLSGTIRLNLPLRLVDPYLVAPENDEGIVPTNLRVRISFLDPSKAQPLEAVIEAAKGVGSGHFQCDYGLGLMYQETLEQEIDLSKPFSDKKSR
jgi:hypothetical protein